jgi:hypothetical protein
VSRFVPSPIRATSVSPILSMVVVFDWTMFTSFLIGGPLVGCRVSPVLRAPEGFQKGGGAGFEGAWRGGHRGTLWPAEGAVCVLVCSVKSDNPNHRPMALVHQADAISQKYGLLGEGRPRQARALPSPLAALHRAVPSHAPQGRILARGDAVSTRRHEHSGIRARARQQ